MKLSCSLLKVWKWHCAIVTVTVSNKFLVEPYTHTHTYVHAHRVKMQGLMLNRSQFNHITFRFMNMDIFRPEMQNVRAKALQLL